MQDWNLEDNFAGLENEGLENVEVSGKEILHEIQMIES